MQSVRVAVETEENPARQMVCRRSLLQFAAQSFTYTDNLNNHLAGRWGKQMREKKKRFLPDKVGFRLQFLHTQLSEESPALCFSSQ